MHVAAQSGRFYVTARRLRWALALWAGAACLVQAEAPALQYNRDIRPILSNHCFACHGPDKAQRKAGLRLDVATEAQAEHDGERAIVSGNPDASALVQRILHTDADERMPPAEFGKPLSAEQIETLRRWVAQGAVYEAHWAYIPPQQAPAPSVKEADWVRNPVDAFVLQGLEARGIAPSPEADRLTQIRRLSLDLTGLPPTPDDIDVFLNDARPDAYMQLVERLLATPGYGERMAMDWLDVVRYADTNGYHGDEYRSVYPYRDYVIHAFNANMPYDQFTVEQLAGDLLPNPTRNQLVAASYNRLNQITAEGGAQAKEYIEKYAADRVRTTSSVWLGSTFACAQCHDHKFDPISMKDFYSFEAFFADIEEKGVYGAGQRFDPLLDLPTPEQEQRLGQLEAGIAEQQRQLDTPTDALDSEQRSWEADTLALMKGERTIWRAPMPVAVRAANGTALQQQEDTSVLGTGPAPDQEIIEIDLPSGDTPVTGVRIEALPDPALPNGLSRGNGNFILSELQVLAGGQLVAVDSAKADYEQSGWPVKAALDGNPSTGWAVDGHVAGMKGQARQAVFRLAQPVARDSVLTVRLRYESQPQHIIGRVRVTLTDKATPVLEGPGAVPVEARLILLTETTARTPEQVAALAKHFRSVAPRLQPVRDQLAKLNAERDALKKEIPFVLLTHAVEPRPVRVLPRGNWMDESGPLVDPATPSFLPAVLHSDAKRLTRLDLAKWLVSRDNPLTARVYMNRLWAMYFGAGLSRVLDDLGVQGEWPTNPALLDWLATEFMDSGWDVKHMVRLIVESSAYRQASLARHDLNELDPYNHLIARQSRFRLPAELVRDSALRISGLLSAKLGGPTVKPYQPEGYYNDCNTFTGPLLYEASPGEDQYRRGLYTFWKRSFLHPSMLAFDAPSREECTAVRTTSNTPLQALVLLNDPSYVEAARVFAANMLAHGGDNATARVRWAFRRALGRGPSGDEIKVVLALLEKQRQEYTADPASAEALLSVGQAALPGKVPTAELAAWTSVARAILNLHETITRS